MNIVFNSYNFWNGLTVEQVLPHQCQAMADVVSYWADVADYKIEYLKEINAGYPDLAIFNDSLRLARSTDEQLQNLSQKHIAYVCKDAGRREQGIVIIRVPQRHDHLEVKYLMTHPHNIRSEVNVEEPHTVKGVGTALMEAVEELALTTFNKNRIELYASCTGAAFYEKLGYFPEYLEDGVMHFKTLEMIIQKIQSEIVA